MADFELLAPGGHQKLVDEVVDRLDLKADIDGYYAQLTAGAADNLTGRGDATTAEFLYRTAGGTADIETGQATIRSIHGRTLRWNQLVNPIVGTSTSPTTGITLTVAADGLVSYAGTTQTTGGRNQGVSNVFDVVSGHHYLIRDTINYPTGDSGRWHFTDTSTGTVITGQGVASNAIFIASSSAHVYLGRNFLATGVEYNCSGYVSVYDLTAMFGAGSEPATIAEFEALYPASYYPYDAGSLLPVSMDGIETTSKNLVFKTLYSYSIGTSGVIVYNSTHEFNLACAMVVAGETYTARYRNPVSTGDVVIAYFTEEPVGDSTSYNGSRLVAATTTGTYTFTAPISGYVCVRTPSAYSTPQIEFGSTATDYAPHWHQTRSIPAGTLRSAGSVYDELTKTERITRIGERAYQSGDESDPTVVTDGTVTHYPLATTTTTPIDPPLNLTYRTAAGGTERVMVPTGEQSAPPTIVTAGGYTAESLRDAALSAIAPVENGLASTNYGIGSYLVHDGQLCKVTTAIATGEAITIGTNVTATTAMAEVIALIAQ